MRRALPPLSNMPSWLGAQLKKAQGLFYFVGVPSVLCGVSQLKCYVQLFMEVPTTHVLQSRASLTD
jgi:hypothetical protein